LTSASAQLFDPGKTLEQTGLVSKIGEFCTLGHNHIKDPIFEAKYVCSGVFLIQIRERQLRPKSKDKAIFILYGLI